MKYTIFIAYDIVLSEINANFLYSCVEERAVVFLKIHTTESYEIRISILHDMLNKYSKFQAIFSSSYVCILLTTLHISNIDTLHIQSVAFHVYMSA